MKSVFYATIVLCLFTRHILSGQQNDSKPIIAFDLHGVILHYQLSHLFPYLWEYPQKVQLIKGFLRLPFFRLCRLLCSQPSFEQVLESCCRNNEIVKNFLIEVSVFQSIDPEMRTLISDLSRKKYEMDIVSNIGFDSYLRLKAWNSDFFSFFSTVATARVRDAQNVLLKKPDPQFFQAYLNQRQRPASQIVFVDDREKNIQGARLLGFDVILFKNAKHLKEEFQARQIMC